ncbi:MAG: beta-phosphoglucomutase [Chitinophagales bacterium]|nr:beta-phosphoglucomutase [Chitinophagales bacterium]
MIRACIFDLDGVIVDTAKYHYQAWRRLAWHLEYEFTEEENEKLKGVSRTESLERLLDLAGVQISEKDKKKYCATKNSWYLQLVENMDGSEILPGVSEFLAQLKDRHIKIAIGSASKNARTILKRIGLIDAFEVIVDGEGVKKSKPDPEVFLRGAELMGTLPQETIVFEDSEKGLMAAKAGTFVAVGVGGENLADFADIVIPGFKGLEYPTLLESMHLAQV